MYGEIILALSDADSISHVNCCAITGNGDYFSSGNDLNNFTSYSGDMEPEEMIKSGCEMCR